MTHFGIVSPPVTGHLNPWAALGRELQQRGHRVTVFNILDVEHKILAEGLEFYPVGKSDHPLGTLPESLQQIGKLSGLKAFRFTLRAIQQTTKMFCRDLPDALQQAGIEALLLDQTEPAGATVAEYLGLPFVTVCCALAINREASIPPIFTAWNYQDTWWGRWRNRLGYYLFDVLTQSVQTSLNQYRQQWHLPKYRSFSDSFSSLAQISQQPAEFDFPRRELPPNFHYSGPFRNSSPYEIAFPYEKLTDKPLIYASLGTQQNTKEELFQQIASACQGLDIQLVIAHGGGISSEAIQSLSNSALVVNYAPQYELLKRASLTITHAGLNTVLDSLSHGVPLVAIPITYEQPAIAARIHWLGAGEIIPLQHFQVDKLKQVMQKVLQDTTYYQNAAKVQASMQQAGGVTKAAEIIETAIITKKPVFLRSNN
jgi:MGT family glycosyltransferase